MSNNAPIVVDKVIVMPDFQLLITFEDEVLKIVDLKTMHLEGIFKKLQTDKRLFQTAKEEDGYVVWGDDLILGTDELYKHGVVTKDLPKIISEKQKNQKNQ